LAKVSKNRSRKFQNVWCIKSEDKSVLRNYEDVKKRWKEYVERLLNKEYPKEALESTSCNEELIGLVSKKEAKTAVTAMKNKNAVRPHGVPALV